LPDDVIVIDHPAVGLQNPARLHDQQVTFMGAPMQLNQVSGLNAINP
jgi:hypothetical protein